MIFQQILNKDSGLSTRAKLNSMLSALIQSDEGVNAVWVFLKSLEQAMQTLSSKEDNDVADLRGSLAGANDYTDKAVNKLYTYVDAMNGGVGGLIDSTSYDPSGLPTDKPCTLIALGSGTFTNLKDSNNTAITVSQSNSITVFFRAAHITYWNYKTEVLTAPPMDATPTDGNTTHVVSSDGVYDFVMAHGIDDVDVADTTGSDYLKDRIIFTMRKNMGTVSEPEYETIADFTIPVATATKAGLMPAYVDGVFDVNRYVGSSTPYDSLSQVLNNAATLIPTAVRRGGMSIKFIQSSDNKYVQARCMADEFTTDVTQWQGVDDVPTAGSDNLVKSGGVKDSLETYKGSIGRDTPNYINDTALPFGLWYVPTGNTNMPSTHAYYVFVKGVGDIIVQIAIELSGNTPIYVRRYATDSWTSWFTMYENYRFYKRSLENESIDDLTDEGFYYFVHASTTGILPNGYTANAATIISVNGTSNLLSQTLFDLANNKEYYRSKTSNGWKTWQVIATVEHVNSIVGKAVSDAVVEIYSSLYELIGTWNTKDSASNITGGFDIEGESKETNLKTYFYEVSQGDILKISYGVFSSVGFSIVQAWNGSTFVASLLDSPTSESGCFFYTVPVGVTKIGCTYFTSNVFTFESRLDDIEHSLSEVEQEIDAATYIKTRNTWPLDTEIITTSTSVVYGEVGTTLIPRGTYIMSFEALKTGDDNRGAEWTAYYAGSGSIAILHTQGTTNGRTVKKIVLDNDVERILVKNYKNDDGTTTVSDIQLEVLDWNGYSASPEKGDWKELPYATPFVMPKITIKEYIDNKIHSCWTGKTINYNGDSVTQGVGSSRTGWAKVVNQTLLPRKVNNYAIGGTRLAHVSDVENCLVDRYEDMSLDADIVVIMANTNDYASQVPIGESDSNDPETYNGALNEIFAWLKTNYPTQPIIISTMLKRKVNYDSQSGEPLPITIEQYAEAVRLKTAEYGFILYDAYNLSGLDQRNTPKDGSGISDDGLHPNEAGALALGRKLAAFINAQ